ncbi:MAG: alkaline phosphatase [Prevotellaceae bacterium]|jgi:alkaline phosphatase|nr:alkaline phosphatase [Prevotellaceae bacterium]
MKKMMITKRNGLILILILSGFSAFAQTYNYVPYKKEVRPTKNLIVMIPDGASIGVISSARWYKYYNGMENCLYIDPYICGTVSTFSSNAPIGDSAPTTSCYMTGMPQQTANVAIYPLADPENDLVEVDPSMAYQPLATILEAAKMEQKKAVGLVVTCEFPHATPADCAAHHYNRRNYKSIAPQMAYQNMDVMFGGGNEHITADMLQHFGAKDITYIKNDLQAFRNLKKGKAWALFAEEALPYHLDRNPNEVPSLKEMTQKALEMLSLHENGFFLMVEGSKIDWSAHANDAVGCITEYIAFDDAVGAAIEFAKKDGNTTVVILPDHGNSGFTLGRYDLKRYDRASIDMLFRNVSKYTRTAEGLEKILMDENPENFRRIIEQYTGINDVSDVEFEALINSKNYHAEDYMKVGENPNMNAVLVRIMNKRTYFGFTSGGHTGEEVFLAAYHPQDDVPTGRNTNMEINQYLSDVLGLQTKLPELTKQIFAKHTDVFAGYNVQIDRKNPDCPVLIVKNKQKTLEIPAFKSVAYLNKQAIDLSSVVVYIDKTGLFYLPENLKEKL